MHRRSPRRRGGRAVVVELVGPAGAGKTTLAKGVRRADRTVHAGLSLWGLPRGRLLASAIALIPTMVKAAVRNQRLRWPEITHMMRLDALWQVLRREAARHRLILLDEGPVFALGWLDLCFARHGARAPAAWRRRAVAAWATVLDAVVFLDASDATLADRIRTRDKRHRMRNGTDAAIGRFAAGFRKAFDRVITELGRMGHVVVEQLRTDGDSLDRSAARLLATLERRRNGH